MTDQKIESQSDTRSPDGDLVLAFFGNIVVGIISPTIPVLINGWMSGATYGWMSSLWMFFAMWGGFVGMIGGILNVIVAAIVTPENRRTSTLWMFTMLFLGLMAIESFLVRGVADV
jgi:hypothetical protein